MTNAARSPGLHSLGLSARPDSPRVAAAAVSISAAALVAYGAVRYLRGSSFWLDEAFVAASLQNPSLGTIFGRLAYAQYFPRLYLASIAGLRELAGYRIWVLRLLPSGSFVVATLFWARLLYSRSRSNAILGLLGAALLLGTSFWLDEAVQLKQYTLDVMLALAPFILADKFLGECLNDGKHKLLLAGLALPCCLSYTYPVALFARIIGWQLVARRNGRGSLRISSALMFVMLVAVAWSILYTTDYRFNLNDASAYRAYWKDCSLKSQLSEGIGGTFRLLAKFLWGWHGRMPLVTSGMVVMQGLGVHQVLRRFKDRHVDDPDGWGSRSVGSLLVLTGTVASSLLFDYPICAGRTVLFCQIHLQILAVEGGLFILNSQGRARLVRSSLCLFTCLVLAYSAQNYLRAIQAPPAEDLSPVISLIEPKKSDIVWVHPCSCAQVRALPEPLPINAVHFGSDEVLPPPGERTWIIWTHLGNRFCRGRLSRFRCMAKRWEIAYENNDSGLALAEF